MNEFVVTFKTYWGAFAGATMTIIGLVAYFVKNENVIKSNRERHDKMEIRMNQAESKLTESESAIAVITNSIKALHKDHGVAEERRKESRDDTNHRIEEVKDLIRALSK